MDNKLQFTGRLVALNNVKEGENAKGKWLFADVIIKEDKAEYPQEGIFTVDIKKYDEIKSVPIGTMLTVHFNLKCRENQGKFYGSNAIWKIEKANQANAEPQEPKKEYKPFEPQGDDLPF